MLGVIGAAAIVLILLGAFGSISGAVSGGNTTTINSTTINSNTTVQSTTIQSTTIQSTTSVTSQFFTTDITSVFDTTQITSQTTVVTTITSNSCSTQKYAVAINGTGFLSCKNVQWGNLTNFPSACSNGYFVNQIASTPTCNPINIQFVARNSFTCSDVTSGTNLAMGFALNYTVVGNGILGLTLNFDLSTPNSAIASHTLYQIWYGDLASVNPPVCNGSNVGNPCGIQYEYVNPISFSGDQQITMICSKATLIYGHTYWFDIAVTDSSTATWTYGYPSVLFIES